MSVSAELFPPAVVGRRVREDHPVRPAGCGIEPLERGGHAVRWQPHFERSAVDERTRTRERPVHRHDPRCSIGPGHRAQARRQARAPPARRYASGTAAMRRRTRSRSRSARPRRPAARRHRTRPRRIGTPIAIRRRHEPPTIGPTDHDVADRAGDHGEHSRQRQRHHHAPPEVHHRIMSPPKPADPWLGAWRQPPMVDVADDLEPRDSGRPPRSAAPPARRDHASGHPARSAIS